jgi:hypothetical protein
MTKSQTVSFNMAELHDASVSCPRVLGLNLSVGKIISDSVCHLFEVKSVGACNLESHLSIFFIFIDK